MKRTVVLAILDGWGIGRKDNSNPIYVANPKNIEYIRMNFPSGALQASGIAVGLPWGEEGNSEVGHLTLGAGKIIYQHFPRITLAIRDGSFSKIPLFWEPRSTPRKIIPLSIWRDCSPPGNVHASLDHLAALVKLAAENGVKNLYFHFFTDGKDSPPKSALELLKKSAIFSPGTAISAKSPLLPGRYYALDRDEHWDRTAKTYKAITGEAAAAESPQSAVEAAYQRNLSDEFVEPAVIETAARLRTVTPLFSAIFAKTASARLPRRSLTKASRVFGEKICQFVYRHDDQIPRKIRRSVAFRPETVGNPLGKVLSDGGKSQLRIAETEKYAHVTYFSTASRTSRSTTNSACSSRPKTFPATTIIRK